MINFIIFFQQLIASSTHIVAKDITGVLSPATILFLEQ